MIDKFLRWWLLLILIIIGFSVSWNFGFFHFLHENDFTRLGLINLLIFSKSWVMGLLEVLWACATVQRSGTTDRISSSTSLTSAALGLADGG